MPREPFSGLVHSVFRQACNVELDGGRLLTVLATRRGTVPHGIRLVEVTGFDFRRLIHPGESAIGSGGLVHFATLPLRVDLSGAARARTSIGHIALDIESRGSRAAWAAAWSGVVSAGPADGLGALARSSRKPGSETVFGQGRDRICDLIRSTRLLDGTQAVSVACGAVGLGPGLTPSSDDFLVGYLSGLGTTALECRERKEFIEILRDAIRAAAKHTSLISRAQLEHAADGHTSDLLVGMLEAIADGDIKRTLTATSHVLELGSTSGADTALGLLCGCAAWDAKPLAAAVERFCSEHDSRAAEASSQFRALVGSHPHGAR